MRTLLPLVTLLSACAEGDPLHFAQSGGVGYAPPNSALAVRTGIASGYDGFELDVALTADALPVLNRGLTLDPDRCRALAGGSAGPEVASLTLAELTEGWVCGGEADAEWPSARTADAPPLGLDALLELLLDASEAQRVHLHLQAADEGAGVALVEATLAAWQAFDPPQPLSLGLGADPVARFARAEVARRGLEAPVYLRLVGAEQRANASAVRERSSAVGADGVVLDAGQTSRGVVRRLGRAGLRVRLWGVRDPRDDPRSAWPVEALVTPYPPAESAP